jgi:hypothetical protein
MNYHKQYDWLPVLGEVVQIRNNGCIIREGFVDAVTNDGSILWLAADGAHNRQMIIKTDGNEVWMTYKWETADQRH